MKTSTHTKAGYVAAFLLFAVAAFEVALAAGAPLGRAAWGGANADLSESLRAASGISVVVYIALGLLVLGRVRHWGVLPSGVFRWGTWIVFALMVAGTIMNWASRSPWERYIQGPIVLVLAVSLLMAARAPKPEPASGRRLAVTPRA